MNPQTYMNLKATLFDLLEEKKASDTRIAELEAEVKEKDETIDILAGKLSTATNIADNRAERLRDVLKENRELKRETSTLKMNNERLERKNMLIYDELRIAKAEGNRRLNLAEVKQLEMGIRETVAKDMIQNLKSMNTPTVYVPKSNPTELF